MKVRRVEKGELQEALLPALVEVYAAAFSQPPHRGADPAAFAETLQRHLQRPGFEAVVAEEGPHLAGFAYGYTSRPGGWWHDRVRPALAAGTAAIWLEGAFEFVELAVHPEAQGRGLGHLLHDRLLEPAAASHARAVLSTLEAETTAMHLYRRRGWQVLAEGFRFASGNCYRILGRRLRPVTVTEATRCRIRPGTPQDLEGIRAVACGTWADTYEGLIAREVQHRLLASWYAPEALRATLARGEAPLLVAEEANVICAFAQMGLIGPATAELSRLYVLPAYQRAGLGRRLYEAVLKALRQRAAAVSAVEVQVEEGNLKGRSFYERLGLRQVERLEESLPDGSILPTVRYRLELP